MVPNARVTAFTISELLRENQQEEEEGEGGGRGGKITLSSTQIWVENSVINVFISLKGSVDRVLQIHYN